MHNTIQNYDWGSRWMFPVLQTAEGFDGSEGAPEAPIAELWMGTHPRGPSSVEISPGRRVPLTEILSRSNGGELPFLFKVLTAERGLSIQTHPSRDLAQEGFRREDARGVDIEAPHRMYRDRNHKPELLCAIHEFWGLRGFRPLPELQREMRGFLSAFPATPPTKVHDAVSRFVATPSEATWREAFATLLQAAENAEHPSVQRALLDYCGDPTRDDRVQERDNRYWWCRELMRQFPGDLGAAAPLYLNVVHLHPGEAMYLEAGVLHAYLYGAGVELMAASDNVLRAGCTSKHVDRQELLRALAFVFQPAAIVRPPSLPCGTGFMRRFVTTAGEFELLQCGVPNGLQAGRVHLTKTRGSAAVVLSVGADARIFDERPDGSGSSREQGNTVVLASMESAVVDYGTDRFEVEVTPPGVVYVAGEPGAIRCSEDDQ
ncbi:MAG: mannose-6-phosphate isomerase, class I [Alkalispirochaeta sp.]